MKTSIILSKALLVVALVATGFTHAANQRTLATDQNLEAPVTQTQHKMINIDGLEIFYREAGSVNAPTILLLHGFPTSSHMFRNLIPALSDRFHLIAPDYPGFGNSAQPGVDEFDYTFDNLADIMQQFVDELGLKRYSLVFDGLRRTGRFSFGGEASGTDRFADRAERQRLCRGTARVLGPDPHVLEGADTGKRTAPGRVHCPGRSEVAIHPWCQK